MSSILEFCHVWNTVKNGAIFHTVPEFLIVSKIYLVGKRHVIRISFCIRTRGVLFIREELEKSYESTSSTSPIIGHLQLFMFLPGQNLQGGDGESP